MNWWPRRRPVLRTQLERLRGDLEEALDELRELAHGLFPPLLASEGLHDALSAAARRSPVAVELDGAGISRFPPAVENAVYFCCAEALQNVTKHAGPGARASIRLRVRHGALEFRVTDDGASLDPSARSGGNGLTNPRDRVGALGREAEVVSAPGGGTTVRGHIPPP